MDTLHRTADPESLAAWKGELSVPAYRRALELCCEPPTRAEWLSFLDRVCLVGGAGLILAGIVFFFAYNWAGLSWLQKLWLLEVAVLGLALAGWRLGLDRLAGKVLLASAAILVGPLLAVFGQAYQTGADSYTLFLTWALFILPWVLAARFGALWLFFGALGNLTLFLLWSGLPPDTRGLYVLLVEGITPDRQGLFLVLAAFNGILWWPWEGRGVEWMSGRGVPRAFAVMTLVWLTIPACLAVLGEGEGVEEPLCLALLIALWMFLHRHHRGQQSDPFPLAMALTSLVTVATSLAGNFLLDVLHFESFGVLALAVVLLIQVGWSARWLRQAGASAA